ncbi:hypothetical protein CsSME_00039694 [Camellia sinensis var. sinensis]
MLLILETENVFVKHIIMCNLIMKIAGLGGARVGKRRRKAWVLASRCLLWSVWLERNRHVLQADCPSVPWLENRLLMVLHSWVTGTVDPNVLGFVDFVEDLIG